MEKKYKKAQKLRPKKMEIIIGRFFIGGTPKGYTQKAPRLFQGSGAGW